MITQAIELGTPHLSGSAMIFSAIILSILVPLQISLKDPRFEPFVVKAAIDAAVLIGFPASKAARKYALKAQQPDFLMTEAYLATEPVEWRKLYFRKLFS